MAGEGEGGYGYDPVKYPLQDWPRLAQALHMVLLATIMTYREPESESTQEALI